MEDLGKTTNELSHFIYSIFIDWGMEKDTATYLNLVCLLVILTLIVYGTQYVVRHILKYVLGKISKVAQMPFLEYLVRNKFPHYLALTVPFFIIRTSIPIIFEDFPKWVNPLIKFADIFLVFLVIWGITSIVKSGFDVLKETPSYKDKPMKSYLQVIQFILSLFGFVVIFSIVTGKSPVAFFAAMGAASAILLLMFKDSIMGFVASVQVSTNDMVRLNDWITMPKYGADGDVIEINLTTVKVQNFDKTITTIPTYALISDSFQNWRGMVASGGRRIKRSIIVKQNSIRYVADNELERFKKIQGISTYIDERQAEIEQHNKKIGADRTIPVNGRNLTNSGLFRKYTEWYLQNHPGTAKDMTLMVRQLAPTESGLPFELYVFTNTTNWVQYEYIMADIFDHLIAAVQYFDLEIFERETGRDFIIAAETLPERTK